MRSSSLRRQVAAGPMDDVVAGRQQPGGERLADDRREVLQVRLGHPGADQLGDAVAGERGGEGAEIVERPAHQSFGSSNHACASLDTGAEE